MKKVILWMIALFIFFPVNFGFAQGIVINEILTSNISSIKDEDDTYQDWIELYNNGTTSVSLMGYGLTDDPLLPFKWTFPNVTINKGQYLIVWASDKNRAVAGNPLHTNYKISSSGENIILTNPSGTKVDQVAPVNLQPNISYGRFPNGTGPFVFFETPTPNAANTTTAFSEALSPPKFSQDSAFLTSGFNLTITSSDSGTIIYYTLDGSEPDENNIHGTTYTYKNQYPQQPGQAFGTFSQNSFQTFKYTTPIPIADRSSQPNKVSNISTTYDYTPSYLPDGSIFKGTVIKAKAVKSGALSSVTVTKNYFISPKGVNRFTIPVLSLSTDENLLYDYNNGISVAGIDFDNWRKANPSGIPGEHEGNFYRSGIENERVVNMNYFVNGQEIINQRIGIRMHGAFSRTYPCKSMNLYARSDYSADNMPYKFFADEPYTKYERLVVKNFGSDFYNSMIKDALNAELVKDLRMETEAYQPVITFINGELWGIMGLRERYDNNYFQQIYNIPPNQIDLLENQGAIDEGDSSDYNDMYNYIQNNSLAESSNFSYIQTRMDTDNFMDYFITNIFFQNHDWPGNNIIYWRKKTSGYQENAPYGHDGRWRWALHDMDSTFDDYQFDSLAAATNSKGDNAPNPAWSTLILRKLLENDGFKIDFINRFADLMNTNFLSNRITAKINTMSGVLSPEMNDQYFRWKALANDSAWQSALNEEKDFANQRPDYQRQHIRAKFGISKNINATLNVSDVSQGYIKINTINIIDGTPGIMGNPYPWTGIYFNNIPVKLKAIAKAGFVFDHWTGASSSTQAEITITPTANFSITAVFIPSNNSASIPIYFWLMDSNITNGSQLTFLNSTYQLNSTGVIQYRSCISGYPYPSTDTNYGKASMERRNLPTDLNYRPNANGNIAYSTTIVKGLQIKEPLQKGGLENTLVFNISTSGYKKLKFSFAAINELTNASAIAIDYSINSDAPNWITTGLATNSLPLTDSYQLLETDFSSITAVDNNPYFKIRLRFIGNNITVDNGARITFNNFAFDGVKMPLSYPSPNVFKVGTAISNLAPTVIQTITSYSVSPNLPAGLILNTANGIISGIPAVASPTTTYKITANYTGGSFTYDISIRIDSSIPNTLSYKSPNVFVVNTAISNLIPTVTGNPITGYTISPDLPAGLSINTTNGIISGAPTSITPTTKYVVTAYYENGNSIYNLMITVNDIAPDKLSYTSPNTFTKYTAISNLKPTISGGAVVNYVISPILPDGLILNSITGIISGTPTTSAPPSIYIVTATNSGGSTSFSLDITVNDIAPTNLTYHNPNVFTKNTTITNLSPTVEGGVVVNYSVTPNLPAGLNLNATTGILSGKPTAFSPAKTYTITATNSGGNSSFELIITVNDILPGNLSYISPNVYTKNTPITDLNPTISGGAILNYTVNPNLPAGLSLNTTSGKISGTPTIVSPMATYTVTASNSAGSISFDLMITVNDIALNNLSYTSPNIFTKDSAISNLNPTISGGTAITYSITPNLPTGLSFNTITGIISGIPTEISTITTYTITASNSGGSTSFGIVITVKDVAPNNLSYPSPNVFTKNTSITDLNPIVLGGTVVSYTINPNLPAGLSMNSLSGKISGTPTVVLPITTFIVSALNSGGSTSCNLIISVEENLTLNDIEFKKIRIYPNPFSNTINITGIETDFSYKIFSIEGKLIKNEINSKKNIELSELPVGIYIMQIFYNDIYIIKKIIKNK